MSSDKVLCEYGYRHSVSKEWAIKNPHLIDTDKELLESDFCQYDMCKCTDICKSTERPNGENIIKADIILSAWLKYCRESRVYRILEFFKLR